MFRPADQYAVSLASAVSNRSHSGSAERLPASRDPHQLPSDTKERSYETSYVDAHCVRSFRHGM